MSASQPDTHSPVFPHLTLADRSEAPHRLVPVVSGGASPFSALPEARRADAEATAALRGFAPKPGATLLLPFGGEQWLLVGLGPRGELTRAGFCDALAKGYKELGQAKAGEIALLLPWPDLPWEAGETVRFAGEALLMAGYQFHAYRTRGRDENGNGMEPPAPVTVVMEDGARHEAGRQGLEAALHVGTGIALTRDLINHPAAVAHTSYVAARARETAAALGAEYRIIEGDELLAQGYEAIHTVGRAAEHPPALVVLEYGAPAGDRPTLALVGKGVTFDTGGLDLKPSSAMALMKKDMGGAATVLGAFRAIAGLGLPLHLVCVLGLAENAVDARAYRPGDILRTKEGLTVEITNTDAEGRVVLADALALARQYNPRWMVDFATLTGACRIALGKEMMGLFCDDSPLREHLQAAAEATGDHVWALPLWQPYRKQLDSPVADMVNATTGGMAGAVTAALFLQAFAGDVAWAHLDCYAWSDGDSPLFPKGGSGMGVRLCVELATRLTAP